MSRRWVWLVAPTLACGLAASSSQARTSIVISGDALTSEIRLGDARIILGSDSVVLNGKILARGEDYSLGGFPPVLRLNNFQPAPSDTLRISFSPWPAWLKVDWGRPILAPENPGAPIPTPPGVGVNPPSNQWSDLRLSGNKSFRVISGSTGGSSFGQSLDLAISGELSPGVELTGAVSDRGYDPIYGVANSRINEFDRLYLRLKSLRLLTQVGDITIADPRGPGRTRDMSGGSADLHYPTWSLGGVAARPRGRFQSVRLSGSDGFQGPYQPGAGIAAIVPGSEQVWLDGRLLERGANKDYAIDYPTGRVTFTALHPIDSRSRIEIDFEPLATQYRQEYFSGGGGVSSRDSSRRLNLSIRREGDDRGQSLTSLSPQDISALGQSTDSIIALSGVKVDSLGNYRLMTDSLPDTVWVYVGVPNGDHTVRFSFVGTGKGAYRFFGGDQYQFVGAGIGDYQPIILLTAPQRVESGRLSGVVGLRSIGVVSADVRISRVSRNLWSDRAASEASYHRLTAEKSWQSHGATNKLALNRQYIEAGFVSDQRLDDPDLARQFLAPSIMVPDRTRTRHDVTAQISPFGGLLLKPEVSRLEYDVTFRSHAVGIGCDAKVSSRLSLAGGWRSVWSKYLLSPADGQGRVRSGSLAGVYAAGKTSVRSETEYDERHNTYGATASGTRFARTSLEVASNRNSLRYEFYREDTLITRWSRNFNRHRLNLGGERSLGRIRIDGILTGQWLDQSTGNSHTLLGRANIGVDQPRRNMRTTAEYMLSEERRNARGFSYLQVDQGRGNYRLDNGRYIPDPFGNYIRLEELLSDQQRVRRGERSFQFTKEDRNAVVRLNSTITEELLPAGSRPIWWLVPFASDQSQPYLFYDRRYSLDIRLVKVQSVHLFNIAAGDNREQRLIADQSRVRTDLRRKLYLRQPVRQWSLEEGIEWFKAERDILYGDAGRSLGWRVSGGIRRTLTSGEISAELGWRTAEGNAQEKSKLVTIHSAMRLSIPKRGEMRLEAEAYRQSVEGVMGIVSTVLTDNHEGGKGVNWTVAFNAGVSSSVKASISLNGRYADSRPGQLFARSEMVAEF
ncbi:MAG: hypothetical protein HY851_12380 [candidate division Zixibacteria bacterium]|nr:hypothetical protein [candidate division Zixibacteria bacterium]